ncbi:Extradiol ring-cleavage dioxygenase, class III enzyme, subunit B [Emericellopsis atlantica]|uniref:Extradiol ring-cleavage dioxygenase, class III enzyme, subunit B n=1 Tax=Emericellopsis atlantica TaxID=2614577 RepID=A0A9P7ZKM9_9HYPO|nr:Extradiol ring-cleavage dioxygenase, class III enzyme, subunit B [Emericellopsis atlantica]KAG9253750.1 Extradiol ring-cleavage dioxygenase, class III enzyme, subunit B [Emericellopsis atlantica]
MPLAPVIALSHGGGPMPLLGDPGHKSIVYSLQHRVPKILSLATSPPKAIILVTAHWSTATPTISSGAHHDLLYDYGGFPKEAYEVKYPAPGHPQVAQQIAAAFEKEGLEGVKLDPTRSWDHGVFVPMKLTRPEADIPIVQISVLQDEDPARHLRMGRALHALRAENIAIVGSGFASFHNLRTMMAMRSGRSAEKEQVINYSRAWNKALTEVVSGEDVWRGLEGWRALPYADMMHPPRGGEHFMPLIVCAGAKAPEEKAKWYVDEYLGVDIYTYYWGGEEVE